MCINKLRKWLWSWITSSQPLHNINNRNAEYTNNEIERGGLSMPRIRKLTPLECLKLQGFNEEHFNSVKNDFSSSAIYHVAGDSITTTTLVSIFGEMTDLPYREIIQKYVETLKGDYELGNQ